MSRLVLAHESRQAGSWLTFNVVPIMRAVTFLFFLLATSGFAGEGIRVVGSVSDVAEQSAPLRPGVVIAVFIHAPADYRGLNIFLVQNHGTRKSVRASYPLGSLFEFQLPETAADALKKEKTERDQVQSQIDKGVRREMNSQLVIPPTIAVDELKGRPVPHVVQ